MTEGFRTHRFTGAGGITLAALEAGPADAPAILFLHGFCQAGIAFAPQLAGPLAGRFRLVALDLRGHGGSDRPDGVYGDGALWAGDVAATIAALDLGRPVLVGWSYGGAVIGDYLARHGDGGIAGLVMIGACPKIGPTARPFVGDLGKGCFRQLLGDDFATALEAARTLSHRMAARPLPPAAVERGIGCIMAVPPHVRRGMMRREVDLDTALAACTRPALIIHGTEDQVVLPSLGVHMAAIMPHAELALYDSVGHAPFLEDQPRFDQDLSAFAARVFG